MQGRTLHAGPHSQRCADQAVQAPVRFPRRQHQCRKQVQVCAMSSEQPASRPAPAPLYSPCSSSSGDIPSPSQRPRTPLNVSSKYGVQALVRGQVLAA